MAEHLAVTTAGPPQRIPAIASEIWPAASTRATALQLPSLALPARLARADTLPPLPVALARRWAVQALAGPALTSRTLGFGQLSYAAVSPTTPPSTGPSNNPFTRKATSTWQPANEAAASGFGAEVQLHRQLSGRWSLSTGLGYHTFATSQTVDVRVTYGPPVATSNFRPDSVGSLQVRNTYHFLTLPLRVGYQLGAGHPRLRYGLRAGADVAFYLGGRSFEGTSPGRTSSSWGASGSPYRSLSLALSLGADVRYQLAPAWEIVVQPTLTQFATSVAQPTTGYVSRYPVAATALVGVAWWLR